MVYIYRGMARGAHTLVNLNDINKDQGTVGLSRGAGTAPIPTKDFKEISEKCKLSGSVQAKIGKLKMDDKRAKEQKLRDLSPIKFSLTDKPKK